MGIVDEAIEHGVGTGGISNEHMPLVREKLAGDDGGTVTVAIFEDCQEVMTAPASSGSSPPIVEDQQIDAAGSLSPHTSSAGSMQRRPVVLYIVQPMPGPGFVPLDLAAGRHAIAIT